MMPQIPKYPSNVHRQRAYRERLVQARAAQLNVRGLPALPAIPTIPGEPRWRAGLGHALAHVKSVHTEMQDYYDQRSEQWQESDRGTEFLERTEAIEALVESLGEFAT